MNITFMTDQTHYFISTDLLGHESCFSNTQCKFCFVNITYKEIYLIETICEAPPISRLHVCKGLSRRLMPSPSSGWSDRKSKETTAWLRITKVMLWYFAIIHTIIRSGRSSGFPKIRWSNHCCKCTLCPKKESIKLFVITLSNLNRFSKFFHWWILQEIWSQIITNDPNTP